VCRVLFFGYLETPYDADALHLLDPRLRGHLLAWSTLPHCLPTFPIAERAHPSRLARFLLDVTRQSCWPFRVLLPATSVLTPKAGIYTVARKAHDLASVVLT